MATFTGRYPGSTYGGILNVDNSNLGVDSTLRSIQDGLGHTVPMQVSTSAINITSLQYNGNTVAFSGAFSFTATLTGATTVTFPTTGTLATLAGTETLTNKTLTAPIISTISNTGTLTLPTSTDTLVGRATSDTLTNKTLSSPTLSGTVAGSPTYSGVLTYSNAINEHQATDIASAATTDIGAANGTYVHVTGTTTITSLGTAQAGTRRVVMFTGALTLTYNAVSLILPTSLNVTTAAGDCATFVSEGSGNWRCVSYTRADGTPLVASAINDATISISDITTNNVSTTKHGWMVKVPGTNTVWLGSGTGSYGQVPLTTHVTGTLPVANGGTGVTSFDACLQRVVVESATAASGTTILPYDNTVPQNTEGDQYITVTITPTSASSALKIRAMLNVGGNSTGAGALSAALFRDSTAGAIAATAITFTPTIVHAGQMTLEHQVTAGSTAATTFKIRIGLNATGTTYFNSDNTLVNMFGGVMVSTLEVTEWAS